MTDAPLPTGTYWPRYTDPHRPGKHAGDFEPQAPMPGWVCSLCGAVVAHRGHHNQWHDRQAQ